MPPFDIRPSTENDVPAITEIYSHYVLQTAATFELTPPAQHEMARRRSKVLELKLPHLVAEHEGRAIGWAYASEYRPRPAYRFAIEDSVYVDPSHVGRGCGKALLGALIESCETGPWRQMIAVIAHTGDNASVRLHERFGFQHVGTLRSVGFKFGCWLDTVLMQRGLGQ